MMEELIAILFVSREFAHRRHLAVTGPGSYAAHQALGSFYDDIIDNADKIAEAYQGRHGLMDDIPYLPCPTGKKTRWRRSTRFATTPAPKKRQRSRI